MRALLLAVTLAVSMVGCAATRAGGVSRCATSSASPNAAAARTLVEYKIDGTAVRPTGYYSIGDTLRARGRGDLATYRTLVWRLDDAETVRLQTDGDGRYLRAGADGRLEVAAVVVDEPIDTDDNENARSEPATPLTSLSPTALGRLRGLYLDHWSDDIAAAVAHLDAHRSCIYLGQGVAEATQRRLPKLPRDTECLVVDGRFTELENLTELHDLLILDVGVDVSEQALDVRLFANARQLRVLSVRAKQLTHLEAVADLSELRRLTVRVNEPYDLGALAHHPALMELRISLEDSRNVRVLANLPALRRLDLDGVESIDLAEISGIEQLHSLSLWGQRVTNVESLARLTELRSLTLQEVQGIADLEFARAMTKLSYLNVSETAIADLRPLESLPLERLNVSGTKVADLEPLACSASLQSLNLRATPVASVTELEELQLAKLDLRDTRVTAEAVQRYARSHPAVEILRWWETPFRAVVQSSDRVVVKASKPDEAGYRLLGEIREASAVAELVDNIRVYGLAPNTLGRLFYCRCAVHFEFYAGTSLVETLTYHEPRDLYAKTMGSVKLRPESAKYLQDLLGTFGYRSE